MFRIEVLGPTEVVTSSHRREVPGSHTRALLHRLIVSIGQPVNSAELMDCIWGKPVNPQTLRTLVSRCRSTLSNSMDVISAGPAGYRLAAVGLAVDLTEFVELADQARSDGDCGSNQRPPSVDERLAKEALELWRGRPFHENANELWALPTVRRLELTRLELLRQVAAVRAESQDWAEVASVAVQLTESDPYDEHAVLLGARALLGRGQRVEALRTLDAFRTMLREELGLDPGPELASFEMQLLRSELAASPLVSVEPKRSGSSRFGPRFGELQLSGRVDATETVAELIRARVDQRSGSNALITGVSGIGKSRICLETLLQAERDGFRTAFARWNEQPTGVFSVLREIAAQLGASWTLTLEGSDNKSLDHRYDIAVSLAEQLRRSGATTSTLVALDDLQWADEDSLVVLRFLFSMVIDLPIIFMCTHMNVPSRTFQYSPILEDCLRSGWLQEVEIGLLDQSASHEILRQVAPALPTDLAARLSHVAEGNPFLLIELARQYAGAVVVPGQPLQFPRSIGALYQPLLDRLGDDGARVLELASIIGRNVERLLLETVCAQYSLAPSQITLTLDWAVRFGLLADSATTEVVAFSNEAVREYLSAASSAVLRSERHEAIARAMIGISHFATQHERIAHHCVAAGSSMTDEAIHHLLVSARDALEAGSYERGEHCAAIVRRLVHDPSDARTLEAAVVEAAAQMVRGSVSSAQQMLSDTAKTAQSCNHNEVVVQAASLISGPWLPQRADPLVCSLIIVAMSLASDEKRKWQLRLLWARQQWNEPDVLGAAREVAADALEGDVPNDFRIEALAANISLNRGPNTAAKRQQWADELRERIGDNGLHRLANFATMHRLVAAAQVGDDIGVEWGLARLDLLARSTARPVTQWIAAYSAASVEIWRGDFEAAGRRSRDARSMGKQTGLSDVDVIFGLQNLERRRRSGRLAESAALLEGSVTKPVDPLWDAYAALALAESNDERAFQILDGLLLRAPRAFDYVLHSTLQIALFAAQRAGHSEAVSVFNDRLLIFGDATPVTADLTSIVG